MWNQKPCFRFEIDNFSEKKATIKSNSFVSGGCEWYLKLHPRGDCLSGDRLSLYLFVTNYKSLEQGWERIANYYFVMLNQSDKKLYKSPLGKESSVFCSKNPGWGFRKTLPLSLFQEKGFLGNDRLTIEVYIKIAEDFKPKNQVVKTEYMHFNHIERFHKPSQNLSETDLRNAHKELSELDEVSLERKKADADGCRVQQLEERVKNIERMELEFKLDCLKTKLEEFSLETKKTDDADGSRVTQLEKSVKNIELMDLGFKVDCLNSKLEEVYLVMKKSDDANRSRVKQLEERVKNLEMMDLGFKVDCLKSMLEDVHLEMKKSDDTDGSRIQQLEECFKNLKMLVSDLKVELDKENGKSCDDGFLLVDEVV